MVAPGHAVGLRDAAASTRSGPHRAVAGDRLRALPGHGDRRHQVGGQRAVHVLARRQPAGRPRAGRAQLLGGVRGDGRTVPGRRGRPGPGHMDDRRRPRPRHLGHGRGPLRRLRHPRLHQRQGPGELQPAVPHHLPQRGAAGGPPAPHHADPRPAHRAQRRVGRVVRAGARAVVPAPGRGAGRGGDVPAVQRLPPGGRGVRGGARAGRPDGDVELRQVPGDAGRERRRGCRVSSPTGCPRWVASRSRRC